MTNDRVLKTLIHHNPVNGTQAKFSMEFTLAVVAITRQAGLAEFTTDMLNRTDVRAITERVDYTAYDLPDDTYTNVTTLIDVLLQDGQVLSGSANYAVGSTNSPMGFDEVVEKFRGCAAYGRWPKERIAEIESIVRSLDTLENTETLVQTLIDNE